MMIALKFYSIFIIVALMSSVIMNKKSSTGLLIFSSLTMGPVLIYLLFGGV